VRQQDVYPANGGEVQLKLCATPSPPFSRDGNISVADCRHLFWFVKIFKQI